MKQIRNECNMCGSENIKLEIRLDHMRTMKSARYICRSCDTGFGYIDVHDIEVIQEFDNKLQYQACKFAGNAFFMRRDE